MVELDIMQSAFQVLPSLFTSHLNIQIQNPESSRFLADMASQKLFEGIPSFPEDIPTASMHTISLASLCSGNEAAAKSLLAACQELGFFLLDLDGDTLGIDLMKEIDQIFLAGKDIMNLPREVKDQYLNDAPRSFLG